MSASKPVKLPTPQEMIRVAFDMERRLMADVTKGREELRRLFRHDGRIDLIPQPGHFYVATEVSTTSRTRAESR